MNRVRRRMRSYAACAVCFGWLAWSAMAGAAERVALVIGNSAYDNTAALPNPRNDATDVARSLDELGFEVLLRLDLDEDAMDAALTDFGRKAERAELALVFYAGHGIEVEGHNYLLPVDAPPLTHERQLRRLVPLDDMIAEAAYARVGIVLVDACRDNPLANNLRTALGASRSVAVGRGLGALRAPPPQTLVVYATEAGQTANDGEGRNSPFTQGLLAHLATPGLEVGLLVRRIRGEVLRLTGNRQQPFDYGSLGADPIYLANVSAPVPGPAISPLPAPAIDPLDTPTDHVELTVRPTPADARVRIMNIAPVYRDGMALSPGEVYDIEVSAPGYATYRQHHRFEAGRRELAVTLREHAVPAYDGAPQAPPVGGAPGPGFVYLRGGRFLMGSPGSEVGRGGDEEAHWVTVGDVWMARTEVTVGEFSRFVRATGYRTDAERNSEGVPGCSAWDASDGKWGWRAGRSWRAPGFRQGENEPVVCVSWNDAQAYARWLSSQAGRAYRLPTEAEWEYAARSGVAASRYWGDDPRLACMHGNVADASRRRRFSDGSVHECDDGHVWTAPVGRFRSNSGGLSDMLGNVWEWTCSAYDSGYGGAEAHCDTSGKARVMRGGGWFNPPSWVRAAKRSKNAPALRFVDVGFRLASSP